MAKLKLRSLDELSKYLGQEIGASDYLLIDQDRINRFADATDDHQWIHVDVARAKAESPVKSTIAHGYLTLSLLAKFALETLEIEDVSQVINYGLNKVRFIAMVPAGSEIRARFLLKSLDEISPSVKQATWSVTIEKNGSEKPVCVAEMIFRYSKRSA